MQTDFGGELVGLIEVKCFHHLAHVAAQFFPRVAFGHNAVIQALRAKSAVGFLGDFKDEIAHEQNLTSQWRKGKFGNRGLRLD